MGVGDRGLGFRMGRGKGSSTSVPEALVRGMQPMACDTALSAAVSAPCACIHILAHTSHFASPRTALGMQAIADRQEALGGAGGWEPGAQRGLL